MACATVTFPAAEHPVLISCPAEGRKLSWPEWLVTYQDGIPANRWRGGATGKAFGLAISMSRVQILLEVVLHNNLRQVVYIYVPVNNLPKVVMQHYLE